MSRVKHDMEIIENTSNFIIFNIQKGSKTQFENKNSKNMDMAMITGDPICGIIAISIFVAQNGHDQSQVSRPETTHSKQNEKKKEFGYHQ